MGLTMREKQAVTREMALVCKRAPKQRKGQVLDSLVGLTEYTTARTLPGCCDNGRAMWTWARGGGGQVHSGRGSAMPAQQAAETPSVVWEGGARTVAAGMGDL